MVLSGLGQAEALLGSRAWEAPPGVEIKGLRCGQDPGGAPSFVVAVFSPLEWRCLTVSGWLWTEPGPREQVVLLWNSRLNARPPGLGIPHPWLSWTMIEDYGTCCLLSLTMSFPLPNKHQRTTIPNQQEWT